ncbi:MAG: hypothetical protein Q9213_003880 [Squamulea squamosa]
MGFTEEEMAQYERLSNNYVPDAEVLKWDFENRLQSFLIQSLGTSRQSKAVESENHRRICPSRSRLCAQNNALAFGYFEAILLTADPNRLLGEVARLTSLNNLLDSVGYPCDIYEDFTNETLQLLKQNASNLPNSHDGDASLLASFNDAAICNAIIMHFRLVTSAWMKTHADSYVHYTENQNIQDYCSTHIEPHTVEIEHLGLQACIDAILKPAGIAVQVLYLDRSPGEQVNQLDWPADPPTTNAPYNGLSTIRLLYRPGHYDILYKPEDIGIIPTTAVTNPRIEFMSSPPYIPTSNVCYSQHGLDLDNFYMPGLFSAGVSSLPSSTDAYIPNSIYASSALPMTSAPADSYIVPYSEPSQPLIQSPISEGPWNTDRFRPSHYQVEDKFRQVMPMRTEPCQTEAMKQ